MQWVRWMCGQPAAGHPIIPPLTLPRCCRRRRLLQQKHKRPVLSALFNLAAPTKMLTGALLYQLLRCRDHTKFLYLHFARGCFLCCCCCYVSLLHPRLRCLPHHFSLLLATTVPFAQAHRGDVPVHSQLRQCPLRRIIPRLLQWDHRRTQRSGAHARNVVRKQQRLLPFDCVARHPLHPLCPQHHREVSHQPQPCPQPWHLRRHLRHVLAAHKVVPAVRQRVRRPVLQHHRRRPKRGIRTHREQPAHRRRHTCVALLPSFRLHRHHLPRLQLGSHLLQAARSLLLCRVALRPRRPHQHHDALRRQPVHDHHPARF
eukprot:Rhum_TRINITY_DN5891_c0_g1::Rhum_TRINITY_DN5891_c0_g1_i1::g.18679::m.18679